MLEYKVDKVLRYLEAICPKLKIDSSTIAGLNDPPPVHRSASPSVRSLSSPGLGVSSLALYDTHSNTSMTSSKVAGPCELPPSLDHITIVAVILRATTKQGKNWVNCQDVSQSAQGGDKSRRTYQSLWSVLELMSFVQGPIEESRSG